MKRLLVVLVIVWGCSAQTPPPYVLQISQQPLPIVSNMFATYTGAVGQTTNYYWLVARYGVGNSALSFSVRVNNIASTGSVAIGWAAPASPTGYTLTYDLLRTTSATFPISGTCTSCLVASAQAGLTATDTLGALSNYTLATYVLPNPVTLTLDDLNGSTVSLVALLGTVNIIPTGGGGSSGTSVKTLFTSNGASNINGTGAAPLNCASNCGVPDSSLFVSSVAGAVLNLTGVTTPNAQASFILPSGYLNQTITVTHQYFTSTDTNTGHSGTVTLTYACGVELINPTFIVAGGSVSLAGVGTATQVGTATTSFTPSCSAGARMFLKWVWTQGTLTYLAHVGTLLNATF